MNSKEKNFFDRVYEVVAQIPLGCVSTYGQIAMLAGSPRAARQVGYALHTAPDDLPCHRVVNRLGELAPQHVFGDCAFQRQLLLQENITFLPNGRVDMKKHLWKNL